MAPMTPKSKSQWMFLRIVKKRSLKLKFALLFSSVKDRSLLVLYSSMADYLLVRARLTIISTNADTEEIVPRKATQEAQ